MWKLIWKIFAGLVTVGSLGGLFWIVFSYTDKAEDRDIALKQAMEEKMDSVILIVDEIKVDLTDLTESHVALRDIYVKEKSKAMTTEDFLRLMQDLGLTNNIKKNLESNNDRIASDKIINQ